MPLAWHVSGSGAGLGAGRKVGEPTLRLQLGRPGSGETGLSFGPLGVGSLLLLLCLPACHSSWWPIGKRCIVPLHCSFKLAVGMPGVNKGGMGLSPPSPPQGKLGKEETGQRTRGKEEASNQDRRRGHCWSELEKSVEPTGRPRRRQEGMGIRWGWGRAGLCRRR